MKRNSIVIQAERCDFCGTCVAVCTGNAIELKESTVRILQEKCVHCGNCIAICPLGVPREAVNEQPV